MKKAIIHFLITVGLLAVGTQLLFPQSDLPFREGATVQDLKEQIADCAINANSEAKYEAKLIARIRQLEKELETAKVKE